MWPRRGLVDRRPPRRSRCLSAENAPQRLHWAEIDGDPRLVVNELRAEVEAALPAGSSPQLARAVIQDVGAVLEAVKHCTAQDPEDVRSVAMNRDLFEIRIRVAVNGLLIRIYETEDPRLPGHIVLLLAHVKNVSGLTEDEISRLQNEQIEEAVRRWRDGRSTLWGLAPLAGN